MVLAKVNSFKPADLVRCLVGLASLRPVPSPLGTPFPRPAAPGPARGGLGRFGGGYGGGGQAGAGAGGAQGAELLLPVVHPDLVDALALWLGNKAKNCTCGRLSFFFWGGGGEGGASRGV